MYTHYRLRVEPSDALVFSQFSTSDIVTVENTSCRNTTKAVMRVPEAFTDGETELRREPGPVLNRRLLRLKDIDSNEYRQSQFSRVVQFELSSKTRGSRARPTHLHRVQREF